MGTLDMRLIGRYLIAQRIIPQETTLDYNSIIFALNDAAISWGNSDDSYLAEQQTLIQEQIDTLQERMSSVQERITILKEGVIE